MFLGLSALINPAAIQLTKSNAYQAAKVVLGLNAASSTLLGIADKYTQWVIPQLNRALTVQQILGDVNFARFVEEGKNGPPAKTVDKIDKLIGGVGGYGLSDSLLFGLPNWILYGAAGYAGYRYYKKKGGSFSFLKVAPAVPTVTGVKP